MRDCIFLQPHPESDPVAFCISEYLLQEIYYPFFCLRASLIGTYCKETTKNAVPFSKDKTKQTYAIVVKMPALLTAARKLADVDEGSGSISFKGVLYPKEKIIIYDLSKGEPTKKRNRKKKDNAEENNAAEGSQVTEVASEETTAEE